MVYFLFYHVFIVFTERNFILDILNNYNPQHMLAPYQMLAYLGNVQILNIFKHLHKVMLSKLEIF